MIVSGDGGVAGAGVGTVVGWWWVSQVVVVGVWYVWVETRRERDTEDGMGEVQYSWVLWSWKPFCRSNRTCHKLIHCGMCYSCWDDVGIGLSCYTGPRLC